MAPNTQDAPAAMDTVDPNALPRRTTPTWEMELLLSGATVFTLWQIAGALGPAASYLLPRLSPRVVDIGGVMYIYLAGGVIMLGLAFVLHLVLRAYWVALTGMHSVFPKGLQADRIKAGPIARQALLARWRDMDEAIERADNRATIVFGLGIGVASILVPITLTVALMYAVVALACWALGVPDAIPLVFVATTFVTMAPYALVQSVDRRWPERLPPGSKAHRLAHAVLGAYARVGLSRESNPLLTLYSSNVGQRQGTVVITTIMLVTLTLAAASLISQRMELGLGNYGAFPSPWRGMPATLDGRHYASMHEPGRSPLVPFVPSPVVRGDYLRLVVPFVPSRHGRQLAACEAQAEAAHAAAGGAGTPESAREAASRTALLDCFSASHRLWLDDQPLSLGPDWYMEPERDLRGLVYMVPIGSLGPGRHELRLQLPDPRARSEAEPILPDRIPFWR